jgi:aspartate kinase
MPVCMISYGSSTHNLSVLVREQDREKALVTLCKAFLDIPSEKFDVIKQTQLQDSFVM